MLKKFLFILFIIPANFISGQNGFSIQALGDMGISHISGNQFAIKQTGYYSNYYVFDKMKDSLTIKFGGGLKIQYTFLKNISSGLGIYYSNQRQLYKNYIQSGRWTDSVSGDYYDKTTVQKKEINLNYLYLPVIFTYKFRSEKKICISILGGMNFGFLINYKINNMKSENGVIYTWNGSDTIADTYSTNENGITRGKKFDYNYTYSSSIFPGGSSHFTNTLNKNAFRLFDPEIILGIGLEWNMNDRFSIPFDFVYYKGFRDVKNLTAQVIGSTYNPPPVTGNYWTAQYDVANPFINSCLNFEIGLIYKFSSKKTN